MTDVNIDKVRHMAMAGVTMDDMAVYFGMPTYEFKAKYGIEVHKAKIDYVITCFFALEGQISDGHAASIMFYLKNVAGWEDIKHTKSEVVQTLQSVELKIPTKEEIEALINERNGTDEA